jgi:hypothetical protein
MKSYLDFYKITETYSFQEKLRLIKDAYYLDKFGSNDVFKSSVRFDKKDGKFLLLFGMEFKFLRSSESFKLVNKSDYKFMDVICIIDSLFRYMNSINKKGYITSDNFRNNFMYYIMDFLEKYYGYNKRILGNSELPYTMWYNFIFINCYYLIEFQLKSLKDCTFEDMCLDSFDEKIEVIDELVFLRVELLQRMDQYLRSQIQIRGITVVQNTYCGFDSEFTSFDETKKINKLVSVQTAVQERTILKIPLYHSYDISYVNPLSSEISDVFSSKVNCGGTYEYMFQEEVETVVDPDIVEDEFGKCFRVSTGEFVKNKIKFNEIFTLNSSLKFCISQIRMLLFKDLYDVNSTLIDFLKYLSKLNNFSGCYHYDDLKRDQFIFAFPLGDMRCCIEYPNSDFTLDDLFNMCSSDDYSLDSFLEVFNNFRLPVFEYGVLVRYPNKNKFNSFRGGRLNNSQSNSLANSQSNLGDFIYDGDDDDYDNDNNNNNNNIFKDINFKNCDGNFKYSTIDFDLPNHDVQIEPDNLDNFDNVFCDSGIGDIEPDYNLSNSDDILSNDENYDENYECLKTISVESKNVIDTNSDVVVNIEHKHEDVEVEEEEIEGNNYINKNHTNNFIYLLKILYTLNFKIDCNNLFKKLIKAKKPRARTNIFYDNDNDTKISLSIIKNLYIIAHYNAADLPMISNFKEVLMNKLSIVNKSFVSIGKPIKFEKHYVYVRDSKLLAPQGYGSLKSLGKLYEGDYKKREISIEDISNMDKFLIRDKKAFEEYALQDAIITLKHSTAMEVFNMRVKQLGIPLTLSSIGRNYVFSEWSKIFKKYIPYQITGDFMMGNADEIQTPKGLFASKDIGTHLSYYIANYKGGRNESFMYGTDENTTWYDYDLTSAYTTGMINLSLPDYKTGKLLTPDELKDWNNDNFLSGYLIINTNFVFPEHVKYPSIPCYVDKGTTVYPLEGESYLTGPEYLLAKNQGCEFNIKSAFYIQPKYKKVFNNYTKEMDDIEIKPFQNIINDIQEKRRTFKKGTIENALYKEMGNSIYGNVVRGISNKKSFDSLTGKNFRVTATELSNPILASWITAFVRSVIGECLHNIQKINGKIVSVTTDGFITNIDNLEEEIMKLPEGDWILLKKYRLLRMELTNGIDPNALELKNSGGNKGVISWTTRGQLGVENNMTATTGFQRQDEDRSELVTQFKNILKSKDKFAEYTRKSLRGAKDIFEKGGHVTMVLKDQVFRLLYDNRRHIQEPQIFKESKTFDLSSYILDSKPLKNVKECKSLRFLSKFPTTKPFNQNNANKALTSYKSNLEIGVRNFIKAYYSKNEKFGLKGNEFKHVKDLIDFIYGNKSTKSIKISTSSISKLRNRKLFWKQVPRTVENLQFAGYVKLHYPNFNEDLFFKNKT